MIRFPIPSGAYTFATLEGDWGSLIPNSHIASSEGRIELPKFNDILDNILYLTGATLNGQLIMAGQSNNTDNCMLYGLDKQWHSVGVAFGIQMVCFSQSGKFLYCVSSANTGFYIDMLTGQRTDFVTRFEVNGIRAIIPPSNKMVVGFDTIFNPLYKMNEYVDFENGFVCGQIDQGYGAIHNGKRCLIREAKDCFANRIMYDGFNIAYGTADRLAKLGEVVFCNVNELKEITNDIVITPINRPHWLGFFTGQSGASGGWDTNDDPPEFRDARLLPGNGFLDVPTSTLFSKNNKPIGSFIHGGATVEEVEEKAKHTPYTPICYWDSRNWPRWPNLPDNSWLCLQAYCRRDESFAAFEADIRAKLTDLSFQKPQQKIAIIAQAYWQTPVNSHTDDLSGLVPIYSRLAAEFPNVIATIPFNGNGRFNGMQDHPEIRPLWEQFSAGTTGEPSMVEEGIPNEFDIVLDINNQFPHLLQINSRETAGEFTERVVCKLAKKDPKWGHVGKQLGQNQYNGHAVDAVMYKSTSTRNVRDIIIGAGDGNPTSPSWGEEENGGQPWMEPINCEDEPIPVGVIDILAFDPVCRRSDPNGCLIRFDIQSPHPVVEAEFDLEGDGEPGVPIFFSNEPRRDGRYVRGFAFKFTVNGTWILRVTAKDSQGNIYRSNGQQIITVTF